VLVLLGLAVIRIRHLALVPMIPVYLFMLVIVASGYANGLPAGAINNILKFALFATTAIAVYEALGREGERFWGLLVVGFGVPILFQLASIGLGLPKASETDGSASYIGGFQHEAVFSVILMTACTVALFGGANRFVRGAMFAIGVIGIWLANYRTTVLALLPLIAYLVWRLAMGSGKAKRLMLGCSILVIGIAAAVALAGDFHFDRFADVNDLFQHPDRIIRLPDEFREADRRFLSGRAYIWSQYVYGYVSGSPTQHVIGHGGDSWPLYFVIYAHNTLVSNLFEYGLVGVAATLLLWLVMLGCALTARGATRGKLIAAHGAFLILNQATMPMWQVEGLLLYALICGYSFHAGTRPRRPALRRIFMPLAPPGR
jgi:hypothetical protein